MNNLGKVIFIYLVIHIIVFIYQENSKSLSSEDLSFEERQKLYDEINDKYRKSD
jgi:L-asparaginase/Glu-tRNA(Gln) amidotransferase subunit D